MLTVSDNFIALDNTGRYRVLLMPYYLVQYRYLLLQIKLIGIKFVVADQGHYGLLFHSVQKLFFLN
jgi:hypothetical protein